MPETILNEQPGLAYLSCWSVAGQQPIGGYERGLSIEFRVAWFKFRVANFESGVPDFKF